MTASPPPGAPWRGRARTPALVVLFPLAAAWLAMIAGLLWWSNAPRVAGWQPRVVLTGSMEPSLSPGDVVLVRPVDPDTLTPQRLVVVRDPGRASGSYVHRVVRRDERGRIVTKGDANRHEDHPAVEDPDVMGEVRLIVPAIGLPVIWAEHNLPALGAAAVVTWASLTHVLHVLRRPRVGARAVPDPVAEPEEVPA